MNEKISPIHEILMVMLITMAVLGWLFFLSFQILRLNGASFYITNSNKLNTELKSVFDNCEMEKDTFRIWAE